MVRKVIKKFALIVLLLVSLLIIASGELSFTLITPATGANVTGMILLNATNSSNADNVTFYFYNATSSTYHVLGTNSSGAATFFTLSVDTSTLVDGSAHSFNVTGANISFVASAENTNIAVDNNVPLVTPFISPAASANVTGTVLFNVTVIDSGTGVTSVTLRNGTTGSFLSMTRYEGNAAEGNWTLAIDTTKFEDGAQGFTVNATDFADFSNATEFVNVTIDNNAPSVTFFDPTASATVSGTVNFNVTVIDSGTGAETVLIRNGTSGSFLAMSLYEGTANEGNWTLAIDTTKLSDGAQTFKANATDYTDQFTDSVDRSVTVANAPSVTLSSPADNADTSDSTPDFAFTSSDPNYATSGCTVYVDNVARGTNSSSATDETTTITSNATLSNGARSWLVSCINGGSVTTNSSTRTLTVDTTSPTITSSSPSGQVSATSQTLTATTNEATTCTAGGAAMSGSGTVHTLGVSVSAGSSASYGIVCTDSAGNTGTATISFSVKRRGGSSSGGGGGIGGRVIRTPFETTTTFTETTQESISDAIQSDPVVKDTVSKVLNVQSTDQQKVNTIAKTSSEVSQKTTVKSEVSHPTLTNSQISVSVSYAGDKEVKDFTVVYDIPTSFAKTAGDVVVTAPGAKVTIIRQNPVFAITYSLVKPGQDFIVNFTIKDYINRNTVANSLTDPIILASDFVISAPSVKREPPQEQIVKEETPVEEETSPEDVSSPSTKEEKTPEVAEVEIVETSIVDLLAGAILVMGAIGVLLYVFKHH